MDEFYYRDITPLLIRLPHGAYAMVGILTAGHTDEQAGEQSGR
jgi:hypothetical protein